MRATHLVIASMLALSACGTLVSESSSTIMVDGRSYELRTSVIDGPQGTYQQSRVVVKSQTYLCLPESPGDCEGAVRQGLSHVDR